MDEIDFVAYRDRNSREWPVVVFAVFEGELTIMSFLVKDFKSWLKNKTDEPDNTEPISLEDMLELIQADGMEKINT